MFTPVSQSLAELFLYFSRDIVAISFIPTLIIECLIEVSLHDILNKNEKFCRWYNMYSDQYAKLFDEALDYKWEKKSSIGFIKRNAKRFYSISFGFTIIVLGVLVYGCIRHPSPLYVSISYLVGLLMYFVFYKGLGYTSSSIEFAHSNYQKFVVETIREASSNLNQDNKTQFFALLLEENALAIEKREKQYNTYFITFLGIIAPFAVFSFNFMSANVSARHLVLKWAVTENFTLGFYTLVGLMLISLAVFGSKSCEYYLLLSNSTPYWKHKAIQKAILDEKYASLCN